MKKKSIKLLLVLGWMIVIFIFSNQGGISSTSLTNGVLKSIISLFNIDNSMMEYLFMPLRKIAHFSEYFILGLLIINFLKEFNLNIKKIIIYTLLLCIIYALSDEIHQLFIDGRAGQLIDVSIDTLGSSLSVLIYYLINKNNSIK